MTRAGRTISGSVRPLVIGTMMALGAGLLLRYLRNNTPPQRHSEPLRAESQPADAPPDEIDRDSQDSFPASDPPSYTPITRIGNPSSA